MWKQQLRKLSKLVHQFTVWCLTVWRTLTFPLYLLYRGKKNSHTFRKRATFKSLCLIYFLKILFRQKYYLPLYIKTYRYKGIKWLATKLVSDRVQLSWFEDANYERMESWSRSKIIRHFCEKLFLNRIHRKANHCQENVLLSYGTNAASKIYEKSIYILLTCQDTLLILNTRPRCN